MCHPVLVILRSISRVLYHLGSIKSNSGSVYDTYYNGIKPYYLITVYENFHCINNLISHKYNVIQVQGMIKCIH